jgi:hypothetical protein
MPTECETSTELKLWSTSEYTPSGNIQHRICGLLSEAIEDLDALKREVAETQEWLRYLEQKIRTDAVRIKHLRIATSSLKKIPSEIITEIFLHLKPHKIYLPPGNSQYPWILGHVCARWRHILWDSPSVWGSIDIQKYEEEGRPPRIGNMISWDRRICEPLGYLLSQTSMTLSLAASHREVPVILDLIMAHNHRFTSLKLVATTERVRNSLLDLPAHSFERLEFLDLE